MDKKEIVEFKVDYEKAGGHIHIRFFVRTPPKETWANAGSICLSDNHEFEAFFHDVRHQTPWDIGQKK